MADLLSVVHPPVCRACCIVKFTVNVVSYILVNKQINRVELGNLPKFPLESAQKFNTKFFGNFPG